MADTLALEKLFDDVAARFTAESTAITQSFGWRERGKQMVQPAHIDWIPGDDLSGDFGAMQGPVFPGRNPRPLWAPRELFTCYIQGCDLAAGKRHDERAQWKATRLVFDAWARAIYLAAHGTIEIENTRYIISKKEARFGVTMRVVGAILNMTPDTEQATAPTDTKARVALTQLAVVETLDVSPAP